MKTLVIGMGCIGGTVASMAKEKGFDVDVVAHGEEKASDIRENGFRLSGFFGAHRVKLNAYPEVSALKDAYDVCFIATKFQQLSEMAEAVLPFLKEDSLVVSLQNGICTDMLAEKVGYSRTAGCMIGFGATMAGMNHVEVTSGGEFYIGMPKGSNRNLEYAKEFLSATLPTRISEDIVGRMYSKLIINSCINSIAGITGKPLGEVVEDRTACAVFLKIAREGMAVAKKMGIRVPKYGKLLEYRMLNLADNAVYNFFCENVVIMVSKAKYKSVRPSTLQALEKGLKTEIDIMNGLISQFGKQYSVPTPVNDKLTQMIKEIENGERKITPENLKEMKKVM